jgi:DNA repair exonuclease SbcCD ATPase subunit
MIVLKILRWSDIFSYGSDNVIYFNRDPITQLVGKNGHGKSSIALILEEVLFNKNSKGIKKADILNRHSRAKSYSIELTFEKDGVPYEIKTTRGSTQTVILLKEGENISAHTATATFKLIEEIIGFDHKTFSQILYQSSSTSLEFLTATDTNRKKFLIDLLDLVKYMEAFEVFKQLSKEVEAEVSVLESKVKTTQAWLDRHLKESLDELEIREMPQYADNPNVEASGLKLQLLTIDATNKKIAKNEIAKKQLSTINLADLARALPMIKDTSSLQAQVGGLQQEIKDADALIAKIEKLNGNCPTCLQQVDREKLDQIISEKDQLKASAQAALIKLNNEIAFCTADIKEAARLAKIKQEYEYLHQQVDTSLQSDPLNPDEISKRLKVLENEILARSQELTQLESHNRNASANNARVQLIKSQMVEMKSSIGEYSQELLKINERLSRLQILQKTFSTSGLIAYKIECRVKDLEVLANEYLADLSSGRFQLTFKVSSGDKLNVIITDNGHDIEILALSGGERARVNTATLLAIRKLMQSLSNARVNLLILDETVDTLDSEGKEKLVEVLLKEEHLNTFLVSHGFTHPLLEKINIVKENNISRLE